ncbi:ATP-binding protein [Acetoanaerobium noterae]|uniref:ATP-binding protein n=1 Tax=Acetoanaerobium noterae TaxID=745369 RepID=UPI0028AEF1B5|nr:ATP-binding protein [Acetoanaerobium noterae]
MFSNTTSGRIVVEVKETDIKSGIMSLSESESIELKEVYTPEVKKEVVTFANTNGGTIYIGVQDNGGIIGLESNEID